MANTAISALTAAASLVGTEIVPVVQSAATVRTTASAIAALATASSVGVNAMTDTWNASGTTFTALKMSVTDTASAAGSLLMQLLAGASGTTSMFSVSKAGAVVQAGGTTMAGHLLFTDATYDIGASGATRPRALYASSGVYANVLTWGEQLGVGGTAVTNFGRIWAPSDGIVRITNAGQSGLTRLCIGVNTSSFPALKPSSTNLHIVLGNDGGFTGLSAGIITHAAGTATPAGGSTAASTLFGTTAGLGIYYGSGAPTVTAAQGSLYIRSDGSSTSTRLYVNTDAGTTWTNVTTAA